jgi:hypothetical protein
MILFAAALQLFAHGRPTERHRTVEYYAESREIPDLTQRVV